MAEHVFERRMKALEEQTERALIRIDKELVTSNRARQKRLLGKYIDTLTLLSEYKEEVEA